MSALATFRTRVLALLDDATQAYYSNDQVDAALRWALSTYTQYRPLLATYAFDVDGNSKFELPADFSAINITKVETYEIDVDDVREIVFYAFKKDEAWWIETRLETLTAGDTITITYSTTNTIDDLDSAAGTTIPAEDEHLVQVGAAGYALKARAASTAEEVNLNDDTTQRILQMADSHLAYFLITLAPAPQAGYPTLPAPPTDTF